ncbi:hypothetical protein EFM11_02175 [Lactobacillus helveticus]|nr:hypothetical protein [Lactobacillus helveticus]MCT0164365.1 hypothetical protein [Lactobacillus helveticus]
MSKTNYSKLFQDAHKEAREIVSEDKIAKLEKQGWSRWTKGNFDRLYFNAQKADVLDLEYRTTGTISNAAWNGKEISNGEARRILSMKAYVDIASGKLSVRYYRNGDSDEAEMLRKVAQDSLDSIA